MIYNKNHDFFTVPNKLNSYWAGFIAADGCVTGKHILAIKLSEKDKEHLQKIATLLAEDYKVKLISIAKAPTTQRATTLFFRCLPSSGRKT